MPRAFLVVKKSEDNSPPRTTSKENVFLSRPEKRLYPSEDSPFYSPRTYSCASGSEDDLSPSPPSSPESLGPLVPDYSMATMTTPREHVHRGGAGGLVQTPGVFPFVNINGAFDMSQKRQRLDMTATSTDDKDLLSPRSTMSSDSDGSHASSSSPGPADIKYMLPKPRLMTKDSHSPMRAFHDHHSRDMVEPLSPLHHLVHSSSYKAAALAAAAVAAGYPAGFGFPTSPMGLAAFPGLGMPMFYPHPMRPYPPPEMLQTSKPSMTPPREKLQVKREDDTEAAPAPKPKTSHNIEDLLARSPPKSKKPVDVPTTVHQYRPVPIVQSCSSDDEKDDDLLVNNPMQKLFEMDKKLAESPKTRLFSPVAHQSPKSGDFPPESMAFYKNKQVQRNLELSFSSSSRGFPGIESMLPGGVNNHQLYAQSYQKLMHAQKAHGDLRRVESDDDEGPSKKIIRMEHHVREYVPDVNTNHCVNATHDFTETVFPRRHGDEVKDMPIHERLSPDALENVPVDFTTSSSTNRKPGPPRFQCDGCKKSYSTMNGLSKHKEFHCSSHVKKEFSCKHCNKTYTSLGALKMHIRTHTLPCKCHICGKAFSRPWLLQGHIRTHTGEKPFSCQHCNRSFADRSNLRAHLQTHTDIKRYCCKICNKTFSRMSLLTKHKENGCAGGMH